MTSGATGAPASTWLDDANTAGVNEVTSSETDCTPIKYASGAELVANWRQ
jgi:hypothetical protein